MRQLKSLSQGPLYGVKSYSGFTCSGVTYHSKDRSMRRSFENSGILCKADTTCYSSRLDNNPISGEIDYYGVLREVIELSYMDDLRVFLFNCSWYNVLAQGTGIKIDEYGFTCVKRSNFLDTDEPYILANQARQVFYVRDNTDPAWSIVLAAELSKPFSMSGQMTGATVEPYQETGLNFPNNYGPTDVDPVLDWCRADIEAELVDTGAAVVNSVVAEMVGAANETGQAATENRIDVVVDEEHNMDMEDDDFSSETFGSEQESVDESDSDFE